MAWSFRPGVQSIVYVQTSDRPLLACHMHTKVRTEHWSCEAPRQNGGQSGKRSKNSPGVASCGRGAINQIRGALPYSTTTTPCPPAISLPPSTLSTLSTTHRRDGDHGSTSSWRKCRRLQGTSTSFLQLLHLGMKWLGIDSLRAEQGEAFGCAVVQHRCRQRYAVPSPFLAWVRANI